MSHAVGTMQWSGRCVNSPGPGRPPEGVIDVAQGTCSVEGCEKHVKNRGWCSAHYARWLRNGEPGTAGDARKRPAVACSVHDCFKRAKKRGFCENHYRLWQRNGAPVRVRNRDFWVRSVNGYIKVWSPEHPCAMSDGYALEHRKVWFDAHGPIPAGAHVHHLNGDKTDNRIENLEVLGSSEHARRHAQESGFISNQYGRWPVRTNEGDPCTASLPGGG